MLDVPLLISYLCQVEKIIKLVVPPTVTPALRMTSGNKLHDLGVPEPCFSFLRHVTLSKSLKLLCLLHKVAVKVLVAQSCPTLCDPMGCKYQASLSFSVSRSLLKVMYIESMSSNHLIPYHPFLLLPSVFPSIRIFSYKSVLLMRWPKYWSFRHLSLH